MAYTCRNRICTTITYRPTTELAVTGNEVLVKMPFWNNIAVHKPSKQSLEHVLLDKLSLSLPLFSFSVSTSPLYCQFFQILVRENMTTIKFSYRYYLSCARKPLRNDFFTNACTYCQGYVYFMISECKVINSIFIALNHQCYAPSSFNAVCCIDSERTC